MLNNDSTRYQGIVKGMDAVFLYLETVRLGRLVFPLTSIRLVDMLDVQKKPSSVATSDKPLT